MDHLERKVLLHWCVRIVCVLVFLFTSIEQVSEFPSDTELPDTLAGTSGGHDLAQDLVRLLRHGGRGKHLDDKEKGKL